MFRKFILSSLAVNTYTSLVFLVISILTARVLGPEGRGIYAFFFNTAGVLSVLAASGFYQANIYFMNHNYARPILLANTLTYWTFCTGLIALLGVTTNIFSGLAIGLETYYPVLMLVSATFFPALSEMLGGIAMGARQYRVYMTYLVGGATAAFLATLPLIMGDITVETAVALRVVAIIVSAIIFLYYTISISHSSDFPLSFKVFIKQLRFGLTNCVQNTIGLVNFRVYPFFLIHYHGATAVGIFSVALLFVEVIRFMPNAIGFALLPRFTEEEDREKLADILSMSCRIMALISAPLLILLLANLSWLVEFTFGAEYNSGALTAAILLIGGFGGIYYQVLTRFFTSIARQEYSIKSGLLGAFTSVVSCSIFVPMLNTEGAAIAFSAGQLMAGLSATLAAARFTGRSVGDFLLPKYKDIIYVRYKILERGGV